MPKWTVAKWETGQQRPSGENLVKVADALGKTPGWIMFGEESAEHAPGGAAATVQESRPVYQAGAPSLAALFADPATLEQLLDELDTAELLRAAYAMAAALGWGEERLRSLDAVVMRRLREDALSPGSPRDRVLSALEISRVADQVRRMIAALPPAEPARDRRPRPRPVVGGRGA